MITDDGVFFFFFLSLPGDARSDVSEYPPHGRKHSPSCARRKNVGSPFCFPPLLRFQDLPPSSLRCFIPRLVFLLMMMAERRMCVRWRLQSSRSRFPLSESELFHLSHPSLFFLSLRLIRSRGTLFRVDAVPVCSPTIAAWRGGSYLAAAPHFRKFCVTKAEWEEYGPEICRRKFT